MTHMEHRNLATKPDIEKVIRPEDERRVTQTGLNWIYDGNPVDVTGIFLTAFGGDIGNDIPEMLKLDLAAMGYSEYDTSKIFEDQTLDLERFGIPI